VLSVGPDDERQEVAEVELSGLAQRLERRRRVARHAQIDILCGAGSIQAELNDEPALCHDLVA